MSTPDPRVEVTVGVDFLIPPDLGDAERFTAAIGRFDRTVAEAGQVLADELFGGHEEITGVPA